MHHCRTMLLKSVQKRNVVTDDWRPAQSTPTTDTKLVSSPSDLRPNGVHLLESDFGIVLRAIYMYTQT